MTEETLYDRKAMRRFAGIELGDDRISDETTILNFRHLEERHGLGDVHLQGLLPLRQSAEVGRRPVEAGQAQQVLDEPGRLAESLAEQQLQRHAGLNSGVAVVSLPSAPAGWRGLPNHGGIETDRQRATALERLHVLRLSIGTQN